MIFGVGCGFSPAFLVNDYDLKSMQWHVAINDSVLLRLGCINQVAIE